MMVLSKAGNIRIKALQGCLKTGFFHHVRPMPAGSAESAGVWNRAQAAPPRTVAPGITWATLGLQNEDGLPAVDWRRAFLCNLRLWPGNRAQKDFTNGAPTLDQARAAALQKPRCH